MISQEDIKGVIDAVTGVFFYALVRIAPVAFSVIATWTTTRGYLGGKIPIDGAIQQLAMTYAACGGLHVSGLLLRTKTAEIASAAKPANEVPNLPPVVAQLATNLEKQTTRETGTVKIG